MATPGQPGGAMATDEPPSPEELLALVEMLQAQGLAKDQIPPDLQTLLDNVKRQKAAKTGVTPPPDAPTEEITPSPGFVIKTSETGSGRKVFINVCSSDRVAAPGDWSGGLIPDEVTAALEKLQTAQGDAGAAGMTPREVEALRFPLACGPPLTDADRKGCPCTVVDVVFNADVVRAGGMDRRLKALLMEVSTGWVAGKLGVELDPRHKLPRMRYKGEVIASQRIRADDKRKKLVTELRDVDEEPSFALRTRKAAQAATATTTTTTAAAGGSSSAPAVQAAKGSTATASASTAGAPTLTGAERGGAAAAAAGPSGRAAAVPASGAAAGGASGGGGIPAYKVDYEGRPVEWVRVTFDLPAGLRPAGQNAAAVPAAPPPAVEVCGRNLFVRFPGQTEVQVPLLFPVSAEGATAALQPVPGSAGTASTVATAPNSQFVVRLPYSSLGEYVADARAQAPLAFGQLSFASKALLELEP